MYRQNTVLLELLGPVVSAMGYELLGIEQQTRGRETLVRLYIDSESGINLDDCARVSEQVAGILDVNDPIKGPYQLEISSPGFDRPLFTLEHFRQFLGHRVRLQLHRKTEGKRKITGAIVAVDEDSVNVSMEDTEYRIAADNIEKARLAPN